MHFAQLQKSIFDEAAELEISARMHILNMTCCHRRLAADA